MPRLFSPKTSYATYIRYSKGRTRTWLSTFCRRMSRLDLSGTGRRRRRSRRMSSILPHDSVRAAIAFKDILLIYALIQGHCMLT
jgi:hypothetical protein